MTKATLQVVRAPESRSPEPKVTPAPLAPKLADLQPVPTVKLPANNQVDNPDETVIADVMSYFGYRVDAADDRKDVNRDVAEFFSE